MREEESERENEKRKGKREREREREREYIERSGDEVFCTVRAYHPPLPVNPTAEDDLRERRGEKEKWEGGRECVIEHR